VLVEGPSDEILFERFYKDKKGKRPIEDGIDVISMRGLALRRCLDLAKALGKRCVALRDNDGKEPNVLLADLGDLADDPERRVVIGDDSGTTLEPQILAANPNGTLMRQILGITEKADLLTWMTNNKTEAALRIAEATEAVAAPGYFAEAINFISANEH
jgi:hypothetical protein